MWGGRGGVRTGQRMRPGGGAGGGVGAGAPAGGLRAWARRLLCWGEAVASLVVLTTPIQAA